MKITFASPAKWPDINDAEREALRHSSWKIDCPRMALKKRNSRNAPTYYGAGEIGQNNQGQLVFKFFVNRERNTQSQLMHPGIKSGQTIPEDAFYDLQATDTQGRVWKANRIWPSIHSTGASKKIIEGGLSEIHSEGSYPPNLKASGNTLLFWVFEDIDIPTNQQTVTRRSVAKGKMKSSSGSRDTWKFRCLSTDFLVNKHDKQQLIIQATSKKRAFDDYFENRVLESLQFVLGRPVHWAIMKKQEGNLIKIVVRGRVLKQISNRFPIPLPNLIKVEKTNKITTKYHRQLFERFLKHVIQYKEKYHPIWGKLNALYEASATSFIDAEALTLAVAIESLLVAEFPNYGTPTKKEKEYIVKAREYIEKWNGDDRTKTRIIGAIASFHKPSATDRLYALIKKKAITLSQLNAWKDIRNPSVHSYQSSKYKGKPLFDLIKENYMLLYHLIFHAIGYTGPYLDYSTIGWPTRNYPHESN